MMNVKLRHFFICNNCRAKCESSSGCMEDLNGDLYPRKQAVDCLGQYCDNPCDLKKEETDLKTDQLVVLVKYLGDELNKHLFKSSP